MAQLRKPVIEKMRRDRINSSIEQLRMLLEKEFVKQQLPSRPEKADILEMTVSFLQRHMAAKCMTPSGHQAHKEGYSTCFQSSLQFLSMYGQGHQTNLLSHFQGHHHPASEELSNVQSVPRQPQPANSKTLWRPW
ncbi:transcription factor HES-5-like [Rhinophrynus dorsalis]